jgi:hypothetical protein
MNTSNQNIPTSFSPETSFAIALGEPSQPSERISKTPLPFRFVVPSEDDFNRRGIPESALHD